MSTHELFAYLTVDDAARAIEFYQEAFGAKELFRLVEPGGRIGHAELDFDGTTLMIADEFPEIGCRSPSRSDAWSVTLHLHVDDADEVVRRAVEAGGELVQAPQDQFYGERSGTVRDPSGHRWLIGHSIEEVSPEEMQRRYAAMFEKP
ncbi:MAG: VOC family protein [Myxococcota bacterium]